MDKREQTELEKTIIKETLESFSDKVEEKVWDLDISYYEAITAIMEEMEYEPELVAKLLSVALRAKLAMEAEDLNLIPKSGRTRLF